MKGQEQVLGEPIATHKVKVGCTMLQASINCSPSGIELVFHRFIVFMLRVEVRQGLQFSIEHFSTWKVPKVI